MKNKRKNDFLSKAAVSLIALVLVCALVIGLIPSDTLAATSDADTSGTYTASLGDNASTEYSGRIWTDKSVYTEGVSFDLYGGGKATIQKETNEDFLVTYSALGTGQSISGKTVTPLDVVFVFDMSSSMVNNRMDDGRTRLANATEALNDAVKTLLALNPYVRIGVVTFNGTSQEILPLAHYEQYKGREFFTCSGSTITYNAKSSSKIYDNQTTSTRSGTNVQKGVFEGMDMLVNVDKTTETINGEEVKRIPAVIMLTDGEPSGASNYTSWWDIGSDSNYYSPGSSNTAAMGLRAIMTATYMKAEINRKYNISGANGVKVYSIGVGITDLKTDMKNLAYATIDPANNLSKDNKYAKAMRDAWKSYADGGEPTVDGYKFTHPNSKDITAAGKDISTLYYVDAYYDADNSEAVTDVFSSVVSNILIAASEVPTEVKGSDPMKDGYITYTDPLGEYTEVKDVKAILYAGNQYTTKSVSTSGNVTTYVFSGEVHSAVYGEQKLNNIIITVTEDANENETIQIKVPASVIPIRVNTVVLNADGTVDTHTNNGTFPIRVIYSVSVRDEVLKTVDGVEIVNTEKVSADYIAKNTNAEGSVDFYSNLYTGTNIVNGNTAGNTTVEFEPSHSNPFYYLQEDVPLYHLNGTPVKASEGLEDDKEYQYETVFYHGTHVDEKQFVRTGAQFKMTDIIEKDGYLYRAKGSPRLNRILEFEGTKSENATSTAVDFYAPTFVYATGSTNAYDGKYVIYLGNNGVVSKAIGGDLKISKMVSATEGLTAPNTEFEFTVDFNGAEVLEGTYEYNVMNGAKEIVESGSIKDGGTITLKAGQSASIKNLPLSTKYKVTEKAVEGFVTSVNGTVGREASGTIQVGVTSEANYTNRYEAEEVIFDEIVGTKILEGRAWENGVDSFTFLMTPYNDAPLPNGYDSVNGLTVTNAVADGGVYKAEFEFGKITFEKPGTYRYIITEKQPDSADVLPGMTYSAALYRLVVVVEDNGKGALQIASSDLQQLYTDAAEPLFRYDTENNIVLNAGEEAQDSVVFTNIYSVQDVVGVPSAVKDYTDHSGNKPLISGMFQFELLPVGVVDASDDSKVLAGTADLVPMPQDANGNRLNSQITENEGHSVTFGHITFRHEDIPAGKNTITFRYQMKEILPTGATAENQYTVNGMKYDPTVHELDVTLAVDANSDALIVTLESLARTAPVFKNEYTPAPVSATIEGRKTLNGRDMLADEKFEFDLTPSASTGLAAINGYVDISKAKISAEVSGGQDGAAKAFDFGEFTFKQAGTYVFYINEKIGTAGGVTYDTHVSEVTITVTDVDGKLQAEVAYSDGSDGAVFVNEYEAVFDKVTSVDLEGNKVLTGQSLEAGEFYFAVEELDENGNVLRSKYVPNQADGSITFLENVTYDQEGTYVYRIYEDIPEASVKGMTYDTSRYIFTVTVVDDMAGNLKAYLSGDWLKNEATNVFVPEIKFTNVYVPEPKVVEIHNMHKEISGDRNKALEANEFQFVMSLESVSAADGILLPGETTADFEKNLADRKVQVGNAADGTIQFGSVTFLKAGSYTVVYKEVIPADADKLPGMTYTSEEKRVSYIVTDDFAGNLTAVMDGTIGAHTFTNVYETVGELDLTIEKVLLGREWLATDAFQFEVVVLDPATQQAIEAGKLIFPVDGTDHIQMLEIDAADVDKQVTSPKITVKAPGTYQFVVREVTGTIPGINYDSQPHTITMTATDNANGTLSIQWTDDNAQLNRSADVITFTNVYDADSTEISGHDHLWVKKIFTGREKDQWLSTDAFYFELKAGDAITSQAIQEGKVVLPSDTTLEVTDANKAHAHFGNITFHTTGTYVFTVTEIPNANAVTVDGKVIYNGITYDVTPRTVKVQVVDRGSGVLEASIVTAESDELTFENTYSAKPYELIGSTNLVIQKTLEGRQWNTEDAFTFSLKADGGDVEAAIAAGDVVMPASVNVTIQKNGDGQTFSGHFGDMTFKKPGEYTFKIQEDIPTPGAQGMTYDPHELEVTVIVVDGNEGQLEATVTYVGSSEFINEYVPAPISVDLNGTKELTGRPLKVGEFHFRILGKSSTVKDDLGKDVIPMPETQTVKNGYGGTIGAISFQDILFTEAGTYVYEIEEVMNGIPGVQYDMEKITATVTITYDAEEGKFVSSIAYSQENASVSEFVFENSYHTAETDPVTIEAKKIVAQINGSQYVLKAGDFQFDIKPIATNPTGDPINAITVSNDENGIVKLLTNAKYAKAGMYTYTVTEQLGSANGFTYDDSVYIIEVVVTEDYETAKMYAETALYKMVSGSKTAVDRIEFTNQYQPEFDSTTAVDLIAEKVLSGMDLEADAFTFIVEELDAADLTQVIATKEVMNQADGTVPILENVMYDKEGTYVYRFAEKLPSPTVHGMKYDTNVFTYTVTVEDDGLGNLKVTQSELKNGQGEVVSKAVFTNTYAPDVTLIDIPVMTKVIEGNRSQVLKAGEFTFELTIENAAHADGILLPGETAADVTKAERKIQAENDADGKIQFGTLTFSKAGDYTLIVKEVQGSVAGMTYSTEVKRIKYRVIDDFAGTLSILVERTEDLTFTNTYGAVGELDLTIAKEFTGRENNEWLSTDAFEFEVVVLDPATQKAIQNGELIFPVDGTDHIQTLKIDAADADKKVTSPKITVKAPGTYKFIVREVTGTISGVNYDSTAHEVVVTATDNADGTLNVQWDDLATQSTADDQIVFINVYDADSTELSGHDNLKITKEFSGRENDEWLDNDSFTFTLTSGDENTAKAIGEGKVELTSTELVVTNANKAYPHFGNMIFHEEGTYVFKVTEIAPAEATTNADGSKTYQGITYDVLPRTVVVEVADNNNGELVATRIDANPLIFENTYDRNELVLSGRENLEIAKTLVGRHWFDSDSFTFELIANNSDTVTAVENGDVVLSAQTLTLQKNGDAATVKGAFGDIVFHKVGTYEFAIREVIPAEKAEGMTYDMHVERVLVTVVDNEKGQLTASSVTFMGEKEFVNLYDPDPISILINGHKVLSGLTLNQGDFCFKLNPISSTLKDENGNDVIPMPAVNTVENGDAEDVSKISFGAIRYTKAGTYVYEITEIAGTIPGVTYDTETVTMTVVVKKDEAKGVLKAEVSYTKGSSAPSDTFTFNNAYTTQSTEPVTISAQKKVEALNGNTYNMVGGEFLFEIEPAHSNPVQDPIQAAILVNGADGTVKLLEQAKYTQPGTYHYTVHELDGSIGGIIYDDSMYEIEVKVADNSSIAQLEAVITITKSVDGAAPVVVNEIVFNNQYSPDTTSALIHGHKNLLGGYKELEAGEFQFKLEAVSGIEYDGTGNELPAAVIPMPVDRGDLVSNTDTGLFQFGRITYTRPGVYIYKVTEVPGHQPGYSYSNATYTVTVTVTDANGALTAAVSDLTQVVFNNYYVPAAVKVTIDGAKVLNGRIANEGEFAFELFDADGNVIRETVNTGNTFTFDAIEYTKAGVYHYTLVEKVTHVDGITYDSTVYGVKVTVTDPNYQGQLTATVEYLQNGQPIETATFNNSYKAAPTSIQLGAVKKMVGRPMNENEFKFVLVDENGKEDIAANKADGVVEFTEIHYEAAGTYVYKIYEQVPDQKAAAVTYDDRIYTVTVTVEDMLNGHLKVTNVTYAVENGEFENADQPAIVFTNTYAPEAVSVNMSGVKELIGRELFSGEFEFALIDMDGQEVAAKNQGQTFSFENIAFDKVGTYYFKIVEKDTKLAGITYNPENVMYDVKVEVTDEGYTGKLAATVTYMKDGKVIEAKDVVFTNIYNTNAVSIQVKAIKKLTGRALNAGEFRFVLEDAQGNKFYAVNAADGSIQFETIAFEEAGMYTYKLYEEKGSLANVDYDETVYTIKITVKDDLKGNLTAEAECDAEELIFHNVYEEPVVEEPEEEPVIKEEPKDTVDSGDHSNLAGYAVTSFVSMMALIILVIIRKRSTN